MFDEWACGFFVGSVPEWIVAFGTVGAAIGTVAAVYTAVIMSRSDRIFRKGEAHEQAMSAAALMRSDLIYLRHKVVAIREILNEDAEAFEWSERIVDVVKNEIDTTLMDRHGDRLAKLPRDLVVPVSDAVGSVKMLIGRAAIFRHAVELLENEPEDANYVGSESDGDADNLLQAEAALRELRDHLTKMDDRLKVFIQFDQDHLQEILAAASAR